jgi:hypothetical protein
LKLYIGRKKKEEEEGMQHYYTKIENKPKEINENKNILLDFFFE